MKRPALIRVVMRVAAGVLISLSVASCAKTISGSSSKTAENGKYFTAGSAKEQQAYFERVKGHFQQIGRPLSNEEVKQHTAAIFIATIPPAVDVYDDTTYMGKTNGQLYFTPGKHRVILRNGDQQRSKVIDFAEGKNLSVVVKF
jgi:hypothetical protein